MKLSGHRSPRPTVRLDVRAGRTRLDVAALLATAILLVAGCGPAVSTPTSPASPSPAGSPSRSPSAPATPSPSTAIPSGLEEELKATADRVAGEVATLRDLAVLAPVRTEVFDQAALDEYVVASFDKETPPEEVEAQQRLYRRLGLLSSTASLRDLTVDLLTSQVLGFYDPDDQTFRVVARGDGIGGLEKITMSHELTHALQDQHFDLDVLLPPDLKEQSDEALAHTSVAEGDATLLMSQWATQNLTPQELVETIAAASDPAQQAVLGRMPPILAEPLQFPYAQGLQFVMQAWSSGGWSAVDALYARPPASTEQVLHSDKYAAGEAPVEVELPDDLASAMGPGWSVTTRDTFGEYLIALWLRSAVTGGSGVTSAQADAAAAGWGGDRLAYLTGPDGADAVIWRTDWDTEDDAAQFTTAALTAIRSLGDADVLGAGGTERWVIVASDGAVLDAAIEAADLTP